MNNLSAGKNRRILVIDDNRAIHEDFRKILSPSTAATTDLDATEAALFGRPANTVQQTQFTVDSAYQGQEGVQLVEKARAEGQPYALAFVDVRMPPGWDGVETTQKIWAIDPDVQIVLCTAYSDYSWDEMFAKLGARDGLLILKKPFDAVEASQLAHALTEKWWLHQQSARKMEEMERMVAERTGELAKSFSLLNATFESIVDGIVAVNLSDKIVSYNTKFADIWQFPAGMLERRGASETRAYTAQQVKDPEKFLQRIKDMQTPGAEGFDMIELKDGRIFERYFYPQRMDGECVGTVINWRDVTERKKAEKSVVAFAKLGQRLSSAITARAAFGIIGEVTHDLFGWDSFWINLYSVKNDLIYSGISIDTIDGHQVVEERAEPKKPSELYRRILEQGGELFLRDHPTAALPGTAAFGNVARPSAVLLFVPVRSRNQAIAILSVQSYTPNAYNARDLQSLQTLADQCGGALERIWAEEARVKSDFQFRQVWNTSADGLRLVDRDGVVLAVNEAYCRMVGKTKTELEGQSFALIHHPDNVGRILQKHRERFDLDGNETNVEKEVTLWDGRKIWFELSNSLLKLPEQASLMLGIFRDITGRKKAETSAAVFSKLSVDLSFANAPAEAAHIISQAADELLRWDAFSIQFYSEKTDTMEVIFDADTIEGRHLQGPARPPYKPGDMYRRILAAGAEIILRESNTSFLPGTTPFGNVTRPSASLLFVPIRFKTHTVGIMTAQSYRFNAYDQHDLRTLQTLADQGGGALERIWVSEALRKSEGHLFQSQKMETVGKLAGGIAHEFNSILTAIIGQSELLEGDLPTGSPLMKNTMEIRQAAERAAVLTRQLLAYGRKQILQPQILELNSVLAGMESTLRHLVGRNVNLRLALVTGLKAIKMDPGQMEQVIVNIVMNASDAMPNGGKLTLETANVTLDQHYVSRFPELKAGEFVMLAITDTGAGMSEAIKARVFEPFFTTKAVGQGTGLGLSTCDGIVKQSGGHIAVYSELGRGTTFKIYLPQVESEIKIPVKRPVQNDLPRGTETILLVEDDPALREMAATLLGRLGYTILTAADGVEALTLTHQKGRGHIDLLFTDVVMPHMSGKELADRVRASFPKTKILFTSAYTENAIVHQGVLDHGVELLQKPFTPSALAHKLRAMLNQPIA